MNKTDLNGKVMVLLQLEILICILKADVLCKRAFPLFIHIPALPQSAMTRNFFPSGNHQAQIETHVLK